jgi:hypothetical protein
MDAPTASHAKKAMEPSAVLAMRVSVHLRALTAVKRRAKSSKVWSAAH